MQQSLLHKLSLIIKDYFTRNFVLAPKLADCKKGMWIDMGQYNVTGMSCAACSARVEKAVSKVDGVTSVSVSLLTNSMGVEGTAGEAEIIKAVQNAGYGASLKDSHKNAEASRKNEYGDGLKDTETPKLKRRLWSSVVVLAVLMYFSMGHMMWNWPLASYYDNNHVAMGLTQLLLNVIIMVINQKFFINGFKSLFRGAPNMDALVALGSGAAFIYSTYALFAMTDAQVKGDMEAVMSYMHEFYFESSAMILTLITVGKLLEARSKGKTTDALKSLMRLEPKTAVIVKEGKETEVPIEQVRKGDIFIVKPGESIPVDGIVLEGHSAVNESALTGESIPADKAEGDLVSAATVNQSGYLRCEAARVGEDTTLSKIIQMVSDAAATKAPIAKAADKVSGVFVPAVITIAVITIIVWLLLGKSVGFALARGISVLVISCPCALGLATPVAIMVGNGVGAKNGILFKTAVSLEETGKMQIVALDKTGTITCGEPRVTDILPNGVTEEELLTTAYYLEKKSEHPLAKAIVDYAENQLAIKESEEVSDFMALPGNGLTARWKGSCLTGGNYSYISSKAEITKEIKELSESLSEEGKTPLFFAADGQFIGMIAVADTMKEESSQAVQELKNMGIYVVMLTGDNKRTAEAIGRQAGVDEVIAGVLPEGKENVIRSLKEKGKVVMVGDGINDAPALTRADIGIAIGAGTDIAIDAADVVLMKSKLSDVPAAIRLSRATLRNIHENLFWAFIYNIVGIPLAAGVWIPLFGWELNPMFGAAAMSLSSFCVVTNALRLNWCKLQDASKDKKIKHSVRNPEGKMVTDNQAVVKAADEKINSKKKETENMEKKMIIEGMMCGHCEATVKKALEGLAGVTEAVVSHEQGTAVVKLSEEVSDDVLKKTVEEKDFTVVSIN